MKDDIGNAIALHQGRIEELQEIKKVIDDSIGDEVEIIMKTRQSLEIGVTIRKRKMTVTVPTMYHILNGAINEERNKRDRLIDTEIEERLRNGESKKGMF